MKISIELSVSKGRASVLPFLFLHIVVLAKFPKVKIPAMEVDN